MQNVSDLSVHLQNFEENRVCARCKSWGGGAKSECSWICQCLLTLFVEPHGVHFFTFFAFFVALLDESTAEPPLNSKTIVKKATMNQLFSWAQSALKGWLPMFSRKISTEAKKSLLLSGSAIEVRLLIFGQVLIISTVEPRTPAPFGPLGPGRGSGAHAWTGQGAGPEVGHRGSRGQREERFAQAGRGWIQGLCWGTPHPGLGQVQAHELPSGGAVGQGGTEVGQIRLARGGGGFPLPAPPGGRPPAVQAPPPRGETPPPLGR